MFDFCSLIDCSTATATATAAAAAATVATAEGNSQQAGYRSQQAGVGV